MKGNDVNERMDDKLWMKSMMESARKKPSENLSYRIMHQIETEQALTSTKPKVSKPKRNALGDFTIFGWMYLVLLIAGSYFFWQGGKEALMTDSFLWTCIMISAVFSFFFLITAFDNSRRRKQKNKPSASN